MVPDRMWNPQTVVLWAVHSHVPARQIFSYKWGAAGWGKYCSICFDWSALMTPEGHPGQLAYIFRLVSYRLIVPKFQHYLSAVALGNFLGDFITTGWQR